ncbi:2Fe-2S iron-sulfur cluster-binding protein [Mycobacterium sp. 236(2023)]|uniref:2Fe-2S iron-sulfur cluster-binding protein n=1 Tax=Mycobacterium sp. 236(2023) TaxID=3038163 RepID=UPI0024154CB3|nr:2Fe-2S iron-sulfur cluster-binding protein [Mycobacterium sp. 236(2023)]MDG4668051.1 2Fe-2S iron-sulfur cluster-binding protein [Mycobacterium sp. 236(2023)]
MTEVVYRHSDGTETTVDAADGLSLMNVAVQNGVPGIIGECGGELMCATCHVYVVSSDGPGSISDEENEMLDFAACPRRENSRLCCQLTVEPGSEFVVETPEAQN